VGGGGGWVGGGVRHKQEVHKCKIFKSEMQNILRFYYKQTAESYIVCKRLKRKIFCVSDEYDPDVREWGGEAESSKRTKLDRGDSRSQFLVGRL